MAKRIWCPHCGELQEVGCHLSTRSLAPETIPCECCSGDIKTNFEIRTEITAQRLSTAAISVSVCSLFAASMGFPNPLSSHPIELTVIICLVLGATLAAFCYFVAAAPLQAFLEHTVDLKGMPGEDKDSS